MTSSPRTGEQGRTAVGPDEEYLFDVGDLPGHLVDTSLELGRVSRPGSPFNLMMTVLGNGLAVFGNCSICPLMLGCSAGAEGWDELDTTFVQGQSMAEMHNGIVRARERQVLWNQSDRVHCVPTWRCEMG